MSVRKSTNEKNNGKTNGNQQQGSQPDGTQPNGTQPTRTQPNGTEPDGDQDAAAIMAQLQMNDLGDANRHNITTVDPGFRDVNLRRELGIRECNDESSDAGKAFSANKEASAKWFNLGIAERLAGVQHEEQGGEPMADGQSHRRRVRATVDAYKKEGDYDDLPTHRAGHQPHISYGNPQQNEQYFQDRKKDFEAFKAHSTQHSSRSGNGHASRPAPSDRGRYTNRTVPPTNSYTINGAPRPISPSRRAEPEPTGSVSAPPKNKFTKAQMELAKSMADTRTKNLSNISSGGGRTGVKRPHQHSFDPPRHCKSTRTNGSNTGTSRGPTTNSHGNGGHGPLWSQAVDHTSRLREPVRTSRNNPLVHSVWSGAQLVENPPLDSPPRAGIPPVVEVRQSTVVAPARLPQASTATETSRPAVTTPSTRPAELSAVIETRQTTVAAPSIPAVVQTPQHIPRVPVSAVQTHTTNDTHERSAPAPAEPNGGRPNDAVARNPVSAPRTPADLCTDDYLRSHPSLAHLFNTDAPTNASSPRQNATPFSSAQVESLLEAVDEREMGNLSTNFAAMSLTSRPAASPAPEAGIMASTHAIEPSPSQSTVSLGATTTTTNPAYLEAISSEDAFWRWKQSQTPNRPNRTGP